MLRSLRLLHCRLSKASFEKGFRPRPRFGRSVGRSVGWNVAGWREAVVAAGAVSFIVGSGSSGGQSNDSPARSPLRGLCSCGESHEF